jgi:hypothetical protein
MMIRDSRAEALITTIAASAITNHSITVRAGKPSIYSELEHWKIKPLRQKLFE